MEVVNTIKEVRENVLNARKQGMTIGFVPTMGCLHEGHISLIQRASKECDYVVVSIFVNPTQFGPSEDYDKYPRDLESDCDKCSGAGCDLVFAPSVNEMYPEKQITWVDVENITANLCGRFRKGHFKGVTTVCTKLFNIVCADKAFFGQKDAQQALVIRKMVTELNMPLDIIICPTIREKDGLAMSSRNKYLTADQRADAVLLSRALIKCLEMVKKGSTNTAYIIGQMLMILEKSEHLEVEYVQIVDIDTLKEIDIIESRALVAMAVYCDSTRLIDNIIIDLNNLQ